MESGKPKGGSPSRTAALHTCRYAGSAFLDAVKFVATAAVLAHRRKDSLEAVEVLDRGVGGLGIFAEFHKLGFEVGQVFPDFGRGRGFAAGLGIRRVETRHL